jgi:nitrous oxide reductase
MDTTKTSDDIDLHRRRFFGTAALTIAAAQLGMIGSADAQPASKTRRCYTRSSRERTRRLARYQAD